MGTVRLAAPPQRWMAVTRPVRAPTRPRRPARRRCQPKTVRRRTRSTARVSPASTVSAGLYADSAGRVNERGRRAMALHFVWDHHSGAEEWQSRRAPSVRDSSGWRSGILPYESEVRRFDPCRARQSSPRPASAPQSGWLAAGWPCVDALATGARTPWTVLSTGNARQGAPSERSWRARCRRQRRRPTPTSPAPNNTSVPGSGATAKS